MRRTQQARACSCTFWLQLILAHAFDVVNCCFVVFVVAVFLSSPSCAVYSWPVSRCLKTPYSLAYADSHQRQAANCQPALQSFPQFDCASCRRCRCTNLFTASYTRIHEIYSGSCVCSCLKRAAYSSAQKVFLARRFRFSFSWFWYKQYDADFSQFSRFFYCLATA